MRFPWWFAPIILFVGLVAGGLLAPEAHAGPAEDYAVVNAGRVCAVIEAHPTVDGVTGVLAGVIADSGFSPYQAGRIVGMAVMMDCPEMLPVLQQFVDRYAPAPEFKQGYIA